jgi:short-subunit dehydrogenase
MKKSNKLLITGASSGVGKSLVDHFKHEFTIIALARRYDTMMEYFGSEDNVFCYKCDLSDRSDLKEVINTIKREHRFVGYIINNAGLNRRGNVINLEERDILESLSVNTLAPFTIMKSFLPEMVSNNFGRIINITSGAPINNSKGFAAYSLSKAALNSLTITTAKEMAHKNIKINLMSPGAVKSEMAPSMDVDPSVCHPTAKYLLHLGADGDTGNFFWHGHRVPIFADLSDTDWLGGIPGKNMIKVI